MKRARHSSILRSGDKLTRKRRRSSVSRRSGKILVPDGDVGLMSASPVLLPMLPVASTVLGLGLGLVGLLSSRRLSRNVTERTRLRSMTARHAAASAWKAAGAYWS
jgi:hypothetical protein